MANLPVDPTRAASAHLASPKPAPTPHPQAPFWSTLIAHVAGAAGIDPQLAVEVAHQESGLNPHAVNPSSGALGIMQLMPATAADLGVNPHNVADNIRGGVHYLSQQLSKFGNVAQALAAYNWGPGNVTHAVARWGENWLHHAPHETRQYVASILARTGAGTISDAGTELASNPVLAPGLVSAQPHHLTPAQRARLQAAVSAYLLAEILD